MKSFKDYFLTLKRTYDFRIKIAGEVTNEQEETMKVLLQKYQILEFKKIKTTPVQDLPLDFPRINNAPVTIWEVVLDYPIGQEELLNYIGNGIRINEQRIVVRKPGNDYDLEQDGKEPLNKDGALLNDPTYKEASSAKFEEYYGDKYNLDFVKALNVQAKQQREARNEKIPDDKKVAETSNDLPQGTKSPVQQAPDPRKNRL